jgi:hypothetical protein
MLGMLGIIFEYDVGDHFEFDVGIHTKHQFMVVAGVVQFPFLGHTLPCDPGSAPFGLFIG